jgi:arylsulfatase A-like enzyme
MPDGKPNILVIWGDDIGISNLSCYSDGLMGYRTPNIDRIAAEGMRFTDSYGEQSCTAGRAAFISGQSVYRTGMSKVGVPGVDIGWAAEDPTIAELLKPLGYATGQFGKNHFGDLNKYLPTVHGFDEFFGNLYHLNAEEEPESPDYPSQEEFPRLYALAHPRCVAGPPRRTAVRPIRTTVRSAGSGSRTPDRSIESGWRPSTTRRPKRAWISFDASTTLGRRSSCG